MPNDSAFGSLQLHSLAIRYAFTRAEMADIYEKHGTNDRIQEEELSHDDLSQHQIAGFLTERHEMDHFMLLTSTPAGVLLWRIHQIIAGDVGWVGSLFIEQRLPFVAPGQSLAKWYDNIGRAALSGVAIRDQEMALKQQYLEQEVLAGQRMALRLLKILLGHADDVTSASLTVGDFVDLLNEFSSYSSRRCDLPWRTRWDTRLPSTDPVFTNRRGLTFRAVFECAAYLKELRALQRMGAPRSSIDTWRTTRVPVAYLPLCDWLLDVFGDAGSARAALTVALTGRVDLLFADPTEKTLLVEEHWPWWRIDRTIEGVGFRDLLKEAVVGLQTAIDKPTLSGDGSRWYETEDPLKQLFHGQHMRSEGRIQEGLKRLAAGFEQTLAGKRLARTDEPPPLFTEYADTISIHGNQDRVIGAIGALFHGHVLRTHLAVANGHALRGVDGSVQKFVAYLERISSSDSSSTLNDRIDELKQSIESWSAQQFSLALADSVLWI